MSSIRCVPVALAVSLLISAFAADASEAGPEYAQVRKIALRDEKVREAFARANERLDARIVALDPALSSYVRMHPSGRGESLEAEAPVRQHFTPAPAQARASRPAVVKPAAPKPTGRVHTVSAGETVSSIAKQYNVSVQQLETANHITDPRKLGVGQTLQIP